MQLLKLEHMSLVGSWSPQAIFWTIAIIATLLLMVLLVYSLFSEEEERAQQLSPSILIPLDARTVLLFFTVFGWAATIASYFPYSFSQLLLYGTLAGSVVTLLGRWLGRYSKKRFFRQSAEDKTGRVLKSIPPHRAGIGKVYMNASRVPVELDAITIGRELPVGVPVRIVDMLDDHTAIVEPIENQPGKGIRK